MPVIYYNQKALVLGDEIKSGAEGTIFHLPEMPNHCVKIFKPTSVKSFETKLQKIRKLITYSCEIGKDAALPCHLISKDRHSNPIGFTMHKVQGEEIHNLYGVSTRQALFPKADFRFLIAVARNAAIATDRLHKKRIVIGDVSGRNLMVRNDGTVCWIDADSFLIGDPNFTTICELATPEWTAPELQHNRHGTVPRIPAHDNFGLAVIIFQLLMLGRHPFQGRYTGKGETPEIATSIARRWYAHAGSHTIPFQRTIGTPLIEHLGHQLGNLFLKAFTTDNLINRPTASDWIPALDSLAKNLRQCSQISTHFHLKGLTKCPWCEVIPEFGHKDPFYGAGINHSKTDNFQSHIDKVLKNLCILPQYPNQIYKPVPATALQTWQPPKPNGLLGLFAPRASRRKQSEVMRLNYEKQKFTLLQALTSNLEHQKKLLEQIQLGKQKLINLAKRVELTLNSNQLIRTALLDYNAIALEQQKKNHLARRRLKVGDVSGIGAVKISQLNGHGIFTAADINKKSILQLYGFGTSSVDSLIAWQKSVEHSFIQHPIPIDQSRVDSLALISLNNKKTQFEKEQQDIKTGIDAVITKATSAANEARRLQHEIDQINANLLAIDCALKSLG